MKISKLNSTYRLGVRLNKSMSSYLESLYNRGRAATPRSWLYEDLPIDKVLSKVKSIIDHSLETCPFREEFDQLEKKNLEKFGPQGEVPPFTSKEFQEVLQPIFDQSKFDDEMALASYFKYAEEFSKWLFGPRLQTKRRKSIDSVLDDMSDRDTLSSNSGYPRFRRRSVVKDEEIQDAISGKAFEYPAILLGRHYHGKLRPVWMYPMSMNLLEYQFSQILQESLRTSPNDRVREHLSPWEGYDDVKQTLTQFWKKGQTIVGGDTTKMDANMRKAQNRLVFELTKRLFQRSEWDDYYKVIMRVNDIPILVGPDQMITGLHGLASGSGFTQILETILVLFIAWLHHVPHSMGIGDDFTFLAEITAETIVKWLADLGLPANIAKQSVSKTILDFLQRCNAQGFFSRENPNVLGAYYSLYRMANSDFLPEKFHNPKQWNSDMFCVRHYMITENGVDDPGWEEYVLWTAKGQKDLINFAKKNASDLNRIQEEARLIPGLNPSYNQEKRLKPLSEFASIKLVRDSL